MRRIHLSPLSLMLAMAAGRFSRRDGLDETKHRCKFLLRSLLTLPLTLRLLDGFIADPALLAFLRRNPRLGAKLHRPYLTRSLGGRGKLAILRAHYRLECQRFPVGCLHVLLRDEALELATGTGRNGRPYRLVLAHTHGYEKEGELSLQLCNSLDAVLVTLTFSLSDGRDGPMLIVGGLQGPRRCDGDAETIRDATKALNGLFPKRVVVEALVCLARELGIERVVAVGRASHVYRSWRYRRHFSADYDQFWQSLGATQQPDGLFRLPLPLPRRPLEDIASKKRAEYQRRYLLLDSLDEQVAALFERERIAQGRAPQRDRSVSPLG